MKKLCLTGLLVCLFVLSVSILTAADSPPNFVVFLADDLGWGDLACYGHPQIKTPNLDAFAKQGVRFTQCYSACGVCSPSRSSILTGRTPYRNGVFRWIPEKHEVHLRTSEITIAELLKDRRYTTCHVGKWHLNGYFNSPEHPQPSDHGFDHWFATQNNAGPTHKNPTNFVRNGKPVGLLEGYSAPLVAEEGIHWLRELRDPKKPFYLNIWTHEPHLPIESDPQFMDLYPGDDVGLRQHHGNVTQLDHAFGKVMAALKELDLVDNTVVFFTSDNGPEGSGKPDLKNPGSQRDRTRGSTGGLRGRKRDDYEGGIRVAGMVRWPGQIQPGTISKTPVIGSDIFATMCEIADIPLPRDRVIDGASMLPAFDNQPIKRTKPLYWRTHISSPDSRVAVRIGDWKIVADQSLKKFQLFNLKDDERETTDLAQKHADKFAEMKRTLLAMDAEVLADGPDWWKKEQPEDRRRRAKKKQKRASK
ncbi:MAG: N-acetylgalactosamine-6-sulfatase [Planctomycetaceae bacterium]|nr:N-acetylgalactosamine-6-sulfatase [Planctomycetaceae bacterium]